MKLLHYKPFWIGAALLAILGAYISSRGSSSRHDEESSIITERAATRSFDIEVRSVGELEAARSNMIFSSLKGDQGKIIHLVADGTYVKTGELLVKLDPTPFEEAIEEQEAAIREQEGKVQALEQALEGEICQAEHETKTAKFEVHSAALELEKITKGDNPQELARLQSTMQKASIKYEEFNGYSQDLLELERQGFLNASELHQAKKKLSEEKEAYEIAKMEYDTVVNYVHPMRIEKANTTLLRAQCKEEESVRLGDIKIAKARALLEHAKYELVERQMQLQSSYATLALTELKAPAPGIVVHREEFRNSQKRKPRVGDVVMRNQALLDLPDLDSMIVKTKVREADLFKIGIGKSVLVSVDAYPQLLLKGKVASIGVLALSDMTKMGDEKYFDVKVDLDKGDPRLRPGMTSRVVILADKIENRLAIPVYAVFEKNHQSYCYLAQGRSKFCLQPVELGASNEYWIEIINGLQEGDVVSLHQPHQDAILEQSVMIEDGDSSS